VLNEAKSRVSSDRICLLDKLVTTTLDRFATWCVVKAANCVGVILSNAAVLNADKADVLKLAICAEVKLVTCLLVNAAMFVVLKTARSLVSKYDNCAAFNALMLVVVSLDT
jgi:hypothetical protein